MKTNSSNAAPRKKVNRGGLIIVLLIVCLGFVIGIALTNDNTDASSTKGIAGNSKNVTVIEDTTQFSRISKDELITIMGEPLNEEQWTNSTSKGDFEVLTLSYDKNSNHYEFIIAEDTVVRLSIYSNKYWREEGDSFSFNVAKKDISKMFGIELGNNVKKVTDNNLTYTLSPVNDKVAIFDVQNINSTEKNFGFVKITYNLNYFD